MHQTKRVAVSSAQTFLQPSAPIKSVRHPAIAARPHQPQHAPADPDTTHLLDPNRPDRCPGRRHTSSVPKPPGSRSPGTYRFRASAQSPAEEEGTTAPLARSAFRSGHPHRRPGAPLRCHPETSSLSCRPETPRPGPAKEQPRRLFRLFRPNRPLLPAPSFRAAFSLKPPQPRNPGDPPSGNIPGPAAAYR